MAANCRRYGKARCCFFKQTSFVYAMNMAALKAAATTYTHPCCFYALSFAFTPLSMAADCRRYENPRCCLSKQTSFIHAINMAAWTPPLRRICVFVAFCAVFCVYAVPVAADCRRYKDPRCCFSKQTSFVYATNMFLFPQFFFTQNRLFFAHTSIWNMYSPPPALNHSTASGDIMT